MHKSVETNSGRRNFRVCLMGAPFDTNNRGVSALSSSLVRLVTETLPEATVAFFMGNPEKINKVVNFSGKDVQIDVINYRLSPRAKVGEHILLLFLLSLLIRLSPLSGIRRMLIRWNARLSAIDSCDVIGVVNGGDSFSDIYGLRRYVFGVLPIIVTILLGKRLVLLPQTYGPYNAWLARAIARWIIVRSSSVLSRDKESIKLIHKLLGDRAGSITAAFCPDVAFTLPSVFPSGYSIYPPADLFDGESLVGINVNGLLFHGGYTGDNMFGLKFEYKTFILKLIDRLMQETSSRMLLVPHTYGEKGNVNSDPEASMQVYEALKQKYENRLYVLTGEYREHEIKGAIGKCDFFIGSRMHACIAAISQGIPTAAVAYSKKFIGVFEGVGLEHMVVDARALSSDEAITRIVDLFKNHDSEKVSMNQKIDLAKNKVRETFKNLFSRSSGRETE
jgi:polysaccharide pyruvyl transferase WcaK-like protein